MSPLNGVSHVTPPLPVAEEELWMPDPNLGECSLCGLPARYYAGTRRSWIHCATIGQVLVVSLALDLPPAHAVRPLLDD